MHAASAALIVLWLTTQSGGEKPASEPRAAIAGTLTSVDSGRPIRKATVKLVSRSPRMTHTTITDAEGRFAFSDLDPAEYTLSASKPGFLEMVFGARRPGPSIPGIPIRLAAEENRIDVSLQLPRGGAISGIVTDEFGDPAFSVPVRVVRFGYNNGMRTADFVGGGTTDDLGVYRVAGLMPGEYIVSAVPRDTVAALSSRVRSVQQRQAQLIAAERGAGTSRAATAAIDEARREGRSLDVQSAIGYVPIYYPSTPSPSMAAVVRLGVSEQIGGIDIQLQVLRTAAVSGVVTNTAGAPVAAPVQLVDPAMPIANVGAWFRNTGSDGRFTFSGVAPGAYVIRSMITRGVGGGAGEAVLWGGADVPVGDGSGARVIVRMQPGASVSGRLDLETLKVPVDLQRLRIDLRIISTPTDFEVPLFRATPDASGKFAMRGVPPGHYRLVVDGLPDGWVLASATFGEREVADYNLHVEPQRTVSGGVLRFTDRRSVVTGVVSNAAGQPVIDRPIVLFPADRDKWVPQSRRIQVAQPDADGRYVIRGLPAGDYLLAAADVEPGQQFDPEFLARITATSTSISLDEGATRTVNLRVR